MEKILLIGNGFDLYHNMPTRYSDFIFLAENWSYFKKKFNECTVKDSSISYEVRLENGKLCDSSLEDFASHRATFDEKAIKYLDDNLKDSKWIQYFKENKIKGNNWFDFETEIEKALEYVEKYYELLPNQVGQYIKQGLNPLLVKTIQVFSPEGEEGYNNLLDRIIQYNDVIAENLAENKRILIANMTLELEILGKCLTYYLKEFVSKIKVKYVSPQISNIDDIYLLNFNYTYTYKMVYGNRRLIEHHPVHGDVMSENIVLGISDEAFGDNTEYVYFQKYFQRIQKRTGSYYKEWIKEPVRKDISSRARQVVIFGHSLGISDDRILKEIFESNYVEKIIIYYHSQEAYEELVINLVKLLGREYVIQQIGDGRIEFDKLDDPEVKDLREENKTNYDLVE